MGVHELTIDTGQERTRTTVLSAPRRCFSRADGARAQMGVFLPLYAVRSDRNWGIGDLTDLEALGELSAKAGCTFVGTLPLLACFLDRPFAPSPYSPVSRLFWNELFLDLESAPEFKRSAAARRRVDSSRRAIEALRRSPSVDYRRAYALKRPVLDALAEQAFSDPARRRELDRFARAQPDVRAYAAFRAAVRRTGRTWRHCPEPMRRGVIAPEIEADPAYRRHWYAQLLFDEQLTRASRSAHLYLDLPVGVHAGGFDTWRYRDTFIDGLTVGAPPDPTFTTGQDWGLPPPHPWRSRLDGHAYFRASLGNLLRRCAVLRIDHVMGLHRLYCIPQGTDGAHGAYVVQPAEELYAILCIESHRHQTEVVGENLGTVPANVNTELRRRGVLQMHVGQFELRAADGPVWRAPRADELTSLNTHDTPPFAAFWSGSDVALRHKLGFVTSREATAERRERDRLRRAVTAKLVRRRVRAGSRHASQGMAALALGHATLRALLRLQCQSPAARVLINLEDLWSEESPQNTPGTNSTANWSHKAARTLNELASDEELMQFCRELAALRPTRRSGSRPARRARVRKPR